MFACLTHSAPLSVTERGTREGQAWGERLTGAKEREGRRNEWLKGHQGETLFLLVVWRDRELVGGDGEIKRDPQTQKGLMEGGCRTGENGTAGTG